MEIIQNAENKSKPPGTVFKKIKAYLSKKAVLLSTMAALSGGCGEIHSANLYSGTQGGVLDQPVPVSYSTGFNEEWYKPIPMLLSPGGIHTIRCDQSNEVKFKSVELWNELYKGAEINPGQCITIEGAGRTYQLFLDQIKVSDYSRREYALLIGDQGEPVRSALLGTGKYLRIGNDATIYMLYDKSKDIDYVFVHSQMRVSGVDMKFENFNATNTPDSCNEFVKNTASLPEVFERVTGVNIGECYRMIKYRYNPDYDVSGAMANMDNVGNIAWIETGPQHILSYGQCARKYDAHEIQHVVRFCANSPHVDERGHIFWNATEAEILRAFGDTVAADNGILLLKQWVGNITNDPSPVLSAAPNVRCTSLKTYFLAKKYLSLPNKGRRELVKAFHTALIGDPRMLAESTEKEAINEIACDLSKDPNCASALKNNCPK